MTASVALAADVAAGKRGVAKGASSLFNALRNFDKAVDGADTGTGAEAATLAFADTRTLAASANENLDLNGGVATFAKVTAILVRASAGNVNDVFVGGAATNTWQGPFGAATSKIAVSPGETLVLTKAGAGWPVVAATGDQLEIANGGAGTGVTYDIVLLGA